MLPDVPLLGRRRFYMPPLSDDAMTEMAAWTALEAPLPVVRLAELHFLDANDAEGRVASISRVVAKWTAGRAQPLVGMLLAVGRIIHYGRAEEGHECPFRFSLWLVDASRTVEVVVWGTAACVMYRHLRRMLPGDLLALGRFRVRPYNGAKEAAVNRGDPVYARRHTRVHFPCRPLFDACISVWVTIRRMLFPYASCGCVQV